MKIGILVHSKTGNTLSVANRLQEKLASLGHEAAVQVITATNDGEPDFTKIVLESRPDVKDYDVLILGAPVRGFSLSPAMQSFLNGVGSLKGKKIACYLTQHLPYPWMGGNRALKQLCKICKDKGSNIYGTGIVNWSNEAKRNNLIKALLDKLCKIA